MSVKHKRDEPSQILSVIRSRITRALLSTECEEMRDLPKPEWQS